MGDSVIKLEGNGFGAEPALRERFTASLSKDSTLIVDFSAVSEIDNRGILFLAQLGEYVTGNKFPCVLSEISAAVFGFLTTLGFGEKFTLRSRQ